MTNGEQALEFSNKPRIVFMGTPEFAVASLNALVNAGYNIVAVVTAPDKPAGRGMQLQESAVKKFAIEKGIKVLQPPKLKNPDFLQALRDLKPDLQVVVAFRMLPEVVWNLPPMGTLNVHGSLLPQYRGAAPINWAIINGEKVTGVTTFRLQHEIDTGDILLQEQIPVGPDETAGELHDRMKEIGASVLVRTVNALVENIIEPKPQPETCELKHAPKIFTETCRINWNQPALAIHNLIRGLSPFPGAFTQLDGKMLKIYKSKPLEIKSTQEPGTHIIEQGRLLFACTNGYVEVEEIQLEGKKRMASTDFLRGYKPPTKTN